MTNEFTTKELLELAVERVLQGMGIPDPSSNRIGSKRFTTTNFNGEVCDTNEFKAKALLEAAIQLDPTLCDDWPLHGLTDDERSHVIYDLQEAEAHWLAEKCIKDLEDGIDWIFVFSRSPNEYDRMSDSKLRTIKRLVESKKDFDFASISDIQQCYPYVDDNYTDRSGNII